MFPQVLGISIHLWLRMRSRSITAARFSLGLCQLFDGERGSYHKMSTGDRVAKLFDMLQAGAINADEYAALKKEAFLEPRSEAPVTPQVGDVASLAQMQKQMAQIANAVQDLASGLKRPASTPGPADVIEVQPALTEIVPSKKIKLCEEPVRGQKSLFQVGCNSTIERGGRKFTLKETQVPARFIKKAKRIQCRWCDRQFTHGPARAIHEKTHKGPMRGQRALIDTKRVREALSDAAAAAEIEKHVTWCLNDLIKEMIRIGEEKGDPAFTKFQGKGKDDRGNNKGSSIRQGRAPYFKLRVINEYDRLLNQYPEFSADSAVMVADSFNVSSNQVQTWHRARASIRASAKSQKSKHKMKERKARGKFAEAEKNLYEEFATMRKQGKRVGPHWLKRCMQRHVKLLYVGTDLAEAAKRFKAGRGWLSRFTSRFKLSLRCKINVKRVPIEQRAGKLKRYFA